MSSPQAYVTDLNDLLVTRQIDNTSPILCTVRLIKGCARKEISVWLSQEKSETALTLNSLRLFLTGGYGSDSQRRLGLSQEMRTWTHSHQTFLAEEIRESGRSFQSLIVCGKKLLLYASLLADGI